MGTAPTGEPLPDYPDDDHAVTVSAVLTLLRQLAPQRWPGTVPSDIASQSGFRTELEQASLAMVTDVLTALQMVGDATLVKNGTLRPLFKDRAELERLTAHFANGGWADVLLANGGNPVDTAIAIADRLDVELG